MNYKAAVFDMDGLLLDTERVCLEAFRDTCYALSLPFLEDVYLSMIGRNAQGIEEVIGGGYKDYIEYKVLRAAWMERYHPIVHTQAIPVKKGVIGLLKWLKENNIPMAVATSTPRDLAIIKLKLSGLYDYFDQLAAGCEVKKGKPDPEIFLLASERLKVAPELCLAFEDSNNGVRSGIAANMQVFQIPDLVKPCTEVLKLGHTIEISLEAVHQKLIQSACLSELKI